MAKGRGRNGAGGSNDADGARQEKLYLERGRLTVANGIALTAAALAPVIVVVLNAPAAGPAAGGALPLSFLLAFIACLLVGNTVVLLERGEGRTINVSSQLGQSGAAGLCHYSASKAGAIGLTRALAREDAPSGVLVNAIAPDPIKSGIMPPGDKDEDRAREAALPIGRFGEVGEVARRRSFWPPTTLPTTWDRRSGRTAGT